MVSLLTSLIFQFNISTGISKYIIISYQIILCIKYHIFLLAWWTLVLNLVKVKKKLRTETWGSSKNTEECEGCCIISIVANIIGKNTTWPNFCYHMLVITVLWNPLDSSWREKKNSWGRLFFANQHQSYGSVKYKFMNLSLTWPYPRAKLSL